MATHYERLGVPPDAERGAIWRAYLSAIRAALSSADPATELPSIEAAWEVLGDPDSRAAYDRELARAHPRPDRTRAGLPPPPPGAGSTDRSDEPHDGGRAPPPPADEPAAHGTADEQGAAEATAAAEAHPDRRRHTGVLEQPRRRRGARRRSDPEARRRAGMALAWLAVCALVGTGAGLVVQRMGERHERLVEGGCVALTPDEAVAVPCDAASADGRISAVVTAPEECAGADGGWVELGGGRLGCIELLAGD